MNKHTFTVGLFDKDAKIQLTDTLTASHTVEAVFTGYGLPAVTTYAAYGVYTHDNGDIVREPSIVCEYVGDMDSHEVHAIASRLKAALNQESIMYTVQAVTVQFI